MINLPRCHGGLILLQGSTRSRGRISGRIDEAVRLGGYKGGRTRVGDSVLPNDKNYVGYFLYQLDFYLLCLS